MRHGLFHLSILTLVFVLAGPSTASAVERFDSCNTFAAGESQQALGGTRIPHEMSLDGFGEALSSNAVYNDRYRTADTDDLDRESMFFTLDEPIAFGRGHLRTIKTVTGRWFSNFRPEIDIRAIAGSPMWFARIFGRKVAFAFGFRNAGDSENFHEQMTIPDAEALNSMIDFVNSRLTERGQIQSLISLRFYEANEPITAEEFLLRFASTGELPIEKSGSVAIHDISYHAPTLILPDWFWQPMRLKAQLIADFSHHLERKIANGDPHSETLKILRHRLLTSTAESVDNIANLTMRLRLFLDFRFTSAQRKGKVDEKTLANKERQWRDTVANDLNVIHASTPLRSFFIDKVRLFSSSKDDSTLIDAENFYQNWITTHNHLEAPLTDQLTDQMIISQLFDEIPVRVQMIHDLLAPGEDDLD